MSERTIIDLTVEEEAAWLAGTRRKRILDYEGEVISVLNKYSRQLIIDSVASALTRYPIGLYLEEDDLEYISRELVRTIEELNNFISFFGEYDQPGQIRSYNQYKQSLQEVINEIIDEHQYRLENLFGIPPEEELNEHAAVVGDSIFSFFSSIQDETDSVPINLLHHRRVEVGKIAIESLLGPDGWADFVRQDIRNSVVESWQYEQDFREKRAREISERLLSEAGPETIIEIYLKTLDQSDRAHHSESLRRFIREAENNLKISPSFSNTMIAQYIGHPGTAARRGYATRPSPGATSADTEIAADDQIEIEPFEPTKEERETGKRLFLFSAVHQSKAFEETVLNGVEKSLIEDFTDFRIEEPRNAIWSLSARGPPRGAADRMAPEDIALFYTKNGVYTHRATITTVRMAPELVAAVEPELQVDKENGVGPEDIRRPIVVFLKDIEPIRIASEELHSVLGYRRDYPTWNTVSLGRLRSVEEVYGGIEALLELLNQNSAS